MDPRDRSPLTLAPTTKPMDPDTTALNGTWTTVSLINDGKTLQDEKTPPSPGASVKLVYKDGTWSVGTGDHVFAKGLFVVDSTKRPKTIDIMDETGKANEQTKLGIYELNGDTYKYCLAAAGKPRPKDFASSIGSGVSLGVSKRDK
jgi:uncharacterized protein (TIGR03067 family)